MIDEENRQLMRHLQDDVRTCAEHLDSEDSPFWRRTFFRTSFSMMEAMNAFISELALEAHLLLRNNQIDLTAVMFLTGRDYRLRDNGTVTSTESRQSFLSFTAFLIRTLAEKASVPKHYLGENGWNQLQAAVAVRNRITHPKSKEDMLISDNDIAALEGGMAWYVASINDIAGQS